MIKDFKRRQLEENWSEYNFNCMEGDEITLAHYVCVDANNDPGFFRWLFDNDELSDFECEDEEEFKDFVLSIKVDEDADDYDVNEWLKTNKISCDFDFCDLYIQAEGGWDGWYHPVWAKIVKDDDGDYIELSLGDQVSGNTSFFEDNVHTTPKSWVGSIPVWHRYWEEGDAEAWAEEFNLNPKDFDSDEELFHEVEGRELDGCFEEAIEEIKQNIIEYAKSKGYDEVEFND